MSEIESNNRRFHIILDSFNCDDSLLSDAPRIGVIIKEIATLCGMKILHGPVVLQGVPENPGVTGFAIIDFSHISIHTFTKASEVCIDIFSCKPFDREKVKAYVMKELSLSEKYVKYIEVKYPALTDVTTS